MGPRDAKTAKVTPSERWAKCGWRRQHCEGHEGQKPLSDYEGAGRLRWREVDHGGVRCVGHKRGGGVDLGVGRLYGPLQCEVVWATEAGAV